MTLRVRQDPADDGPGNMAADEWLAERLPPGCVALRFYGWTTTTISIGAFQPRAGGDGIPGLKDLPLVRRPSGGGAILHGTDITYAVAIRREHPWGARPQQLYEGVHGVVAGILRGMGLDATLVPETAVDPGTSGPQDEPWLCFDRRSPGDLVVARSKLLGSAQRRHRSAVVQHGSLLVRSNPARPDHQGIEEMLGREVDRADLLRDWTSRLSLALALEPLDEASPLWEGEEEAWRETLARYRADTWTGRR